MKKITELDRKSVATLHDAMEKAMQSVAKKYGVVIRQAGGNIGFADAVLKFDVRPLADGKGRDPREAEFREFACLFGAKPDWFGKSFTTPQGTFKIVGIAFKSKKFPILCERSDGHTFKFRAANMADLVK